MYSMVAVLYTCCSVIVVLHLVIVWSKMKQVCLLNLDEGKAKNWEHELKEKIVEKYVRESQELQSIIKSKEGMWSSLKGFFQWVYWLILGES